MTKSGREIMEILEAYDLTGCAHSAAQLAGTDRETVLRYVALREAGDDPAARQRPRSADAFVSKVEGTTPGPRRTSGQCSGAPCPSRSVRTNGSLPAEDQAAAGPQVAYVCTNRKITCLS